MRARDRVLLAEDLRRVYGAEGRGEALRAQGGLGFAVPGGGGPVGWGLRGLFAVLRLPQGALAVLAERQPDGEVHSGDPAGDEGEGSQVSQRGGGVQAPLESERQEGRWAERRLKGFSEARETLEKMLQERYAPRTQTLTHTS